MKRFFDFLISGIGLIFSSPLWIIFSILILLDNGFPILISQKRIGKEGKLFKLYKFRTMIQSSNPGYRITKIGSFLRSTALDELPQLISIFIGKMSFVNPRALVPYEIELTGSKYKRLEEIPGFKKRCSVAPGLTGLAQVYAKKNLPLEKKIKYDLLYIKKKSFILDLKLLILSFRNSLMGKWEI